ncbi:DUF1801 domain-containing protein [Veronia pacifica]|uniref:YdhG-like domain-containing protein n=1 Tax=Veronia pacifica TaxID=1080227 RepID=A0A1C3EP83_9GAMM|nr:DUF1801 domain-containing protein [Veronia pacifica]ODA35050.1 hypothetical protein A8L45_05060 [Veronia pacifica]
MKADIQEKIDRYPEHIKPLILELRDLIYEVAKATDAGEVEESIKWGELSYKVKSGSPLRIDWKEKYPAQCFIFFHCRTKLIDAFRELYDDRLSFEGSRAIVLQTNEPVPLNVIQHCIEIAMTYKRCKHLPLLGA